MIIDGMIAGLWNIGDPVLLGLMTIGVFIGLFVGFLPAVSGLLGTALMLPFVVGMKPLTALPFLLALHAVSYTGGSMTAILVNIPGTGPNAATLIDGFPMTQKGQAGRAMGAAITSSSLGGIVSVFFALIFIPLVIPLVKLLYSAEMFFIIIMGLSFLAVLAGSSPIKGLMAGSLGLLFSFVGFQETTGIPRFTFGTVFLLDKLDIISVVIGLFAVPELIDLATKRRAISLHETPTGIKLWADVWEGVKDVFRHFGVFIQGTVIGYVIGVIPGVGAETAPFIAYGQAKQMSKHPERFGTGIVEGVIAPEASNNAKEAGALLTTLAFGVPGSAVMAILLGAFLLVGIVPGPEMLTDNLELSFTMLFGIAVANLIACIVCLVFAPFATKITTVHPDYLFPVILVLGLTGAFASGVQILNLAVVVLFAVIGFFMNRFEYSKPALLLGFVLGMLFEHYFWHALHLQGPLFFTRPVSLMIIFAVVLLFVFQPLKACFYRLFKKGPAVQP
ncbi:MAG: tripartite tricarboxylate transporter permease [Desulfobacterales bacterium]|nr:tripartite tricarboxylate transporter permease [Desulfobacterales bacterium]